MRSHPYTPASPIFDDLASILPTLPAQIHRRSVDASDDGIALCDLDPDTSQLLPVRRRRHLVRVQGRLASVRSVSTADLRRTADSPVSPVSPRFDPGVLRASSPKSRRRRRSMGDSGTSGPVFVGGSSSASEDEEESEESDGAVGDGQLRGYGIGGVGNIRRPTEVPVYGQPARPAGSLSRLSTFYFPRDGSPLATSPDKRWWSLREFLGKRDVRKGKGRAT